MSFNNLLIIVLTAPCQGIGMTKINVIFERLLAKATISVCVQVGKKQVIFVMYKE